MNEYAHVLREIRSYLLEKDRSENTIKIYLINTEKMLKWIRKPPSKIRYSDIYAYKEYLKKPFELHGKTMKRHTNTLRAIYSFINLFCDRYKIKNRDGVILKLDIPNTAPVGRKREPLTESERDKLYEVSYSNTRDHAIIRCGIEGCLRISEISALNIDDILEEELVVDDKPKTVYMLRVGGKEFTPKDDSYGTPVISKDTYDAIQRWLADRIAREPVRDYKSMLDTLEKQLDGTDKPNEIKAIKESIRRLKTKQRKALDSHNALFLNRQKRRLSRDSNSLSKILKEYGIKADITKNLHAHILRHTGIYFLKQQGFSNSQIQAQSRHKTSQALDRYGKQQITDTASMVSKVYENNTIEPNIQPPKQIVKIQQLPNLSELESKLIQRLANGEISSEVYSHAMVQLKKSSQKSDPMYY